MNSIKILLVNLFFLGGYTMVSACFCASSPFCEILTDTSHVVQARAINFYEATDPYSADRYIDLVVTEFLYGSDTLSSDTLTYVDYQTDCDLHLFTILEPGDVMIYMFEKLQTREEANFSTFNLDLCYAKYLFIEGDSIKGHIGHEILMAEYESFKNNVNNFCDVITPTSTDLPVSVDVKIYPNPVYENIQVKLDFVEDVKYKVFTDKGDVIFSDENNQIDGFDIDMSNLPSGSYYLQIRIKEDSIIKILIKI